MIVDDKDTEKKHHTRASTSAPPELPPPEYDPVAINESLESFTDADARSILDLPPPYEAPHAPLSLPFCLPQESDSGVSVFVRGYSDALATSGIQVDAWLRFVDAVNVSMSGNPFLRAVGSLSSAFGVSRTPSSLTERVLRVANSDFFGPRGLAVRICTTSALKALALRGEEAKQKGKAKQLALHVGRVAKVAALHTGLGTIIIDALSSQPSASCSTSSAAERRLSALTPHVLTVNFDVSPMAEKPSDTMSRLISMKAERNGVDPHHLLAIAEGRASPTTPSGPSKGPLDMMANWKRAKMESQAARAVGDSSTYAIRAIRFEVRRKELLEEVQTKSLLWLVLLNADLAEIIDRTPAVDSPGAVEAVEEH